MSANVLLGVMVANDRLRTAMRGHGYTDVALAEAVGCDQKTVRRWLSGATKPHRETGVKVAQLLAAPASWIWPDLEAADMGDVSEVVGFYPHRSLVPRVVWMETLLGARHQIDIISFASLFLPEENTDAVELIRHKAETGAKVRIALGDPDSPEIELRDREEGTGGGIPGRIKMALTYYRPLVGIPGVEFHLHRTTLYNTMIRFDDQMLVNQHIYGCHGYVAPILHLRRLDTGDLFTTYERSIDKVWAESYPLPAA